MMKVGVIYGLCEPTGELRYVGKTLVSPRQRLAAHVFTARHGRRSHLYAWMRKLLDLGERPGLRLLEEDIPEDDLSDRERTWIAACRVWGCRLVNTTDGGEGGSMPPEVCAKISAWHRGRSKSAQTRAKISAAGMGKSPSAETRAKLSASLTGRFMTAEHRAKIGAAHRGRPKSPEHRAKIRATNLGKKLSPEHRAAIIAGKERARLAA